MREPEKTTVHSRSSRERATARPEKDRPAGEGVGITLEVVEGPLDGACLADAVKMVRIGRNPDNQLELLADRWVSGRHATLKPVNGAEIWQLDDNKSTNGTWVDGVRLTAPQRFEASAGTGEFMVGRSVIRCAFGVGGETFLPTPELLAEELAEVEERFSQATARGYGAAVGLALRENSEFLTERHLFLGLAMTSPQLPLFKEDDEGPAAAVLGPLEKNRFWVGPSYWIDGRLREMDSDEPPPSARDLEVTPRLLRILHRADEEATRAGADEISASHVLRVILLSASSRPRLLLEQAGVDIEPLLPLVDSEPGPSKRRRLREAAPPPAEVTSGDPAVDVRAQETARKLTHVVTAYRLAAPEERRQAVKECLVEEAGQLSPESRLRLLGQLQRHFPVAEAAPPPADGEPGAAKEGAKAEAGKGAAAGAAAGAAKSAPAGAEPAIPWGEIAERGENGGPPVSSEVQFLREVVHFAFFMEEFVASIVQSHSADTTTTRIRLPDQKTSIRDHLASLAEGKPKGVDQLQSHLHEVEDWFVATMSAYHEAPKAWFRDFWNKASPSAIEAGLSEPSWKRNLGLQAVDLWNRYKEEVRVLNPDLVSDEINLEVQRRAQDQFGRLRSKMKQGKRSAR